MRAWIGMDGLTSVEANEVQTDVKSDIAKIWN